MGTNTVASMVVFEGGAPKKSDYRRFRVFTTGDRNNGGATDDLVGWTEREGSDAVRNAGYLDGIEISREEAEALIMDARVVAGWVEAAPVEEPAEAESDVEAEAEEKA